MQTIIRSTALLVVLLLITGGCASEWRWTDPGAHVVSGAWVSDDVTCPMDSVDLCGIAVRAATSWVRQQDGSAAVIVARWAQVPKAWADGAGRTHQNVAAGLFGPSIAILSLASGEVRLVALMCQNETSVTQGRIDPAICSPQGEVWSQYLVGAPAPPGLGT